MTARSDWEWAQIWDDPDAYVRLDGGVYSLFHSDRDDTMHMPRRAPAGFTAEIPPVRVCVGALSPEGREVARHNGWDEGDLITYDMADYFELKGGQ